MGNLQDRQEGAPKNEVEMFEKLLDMGYSEELSLLASKKYPKHIIKAMDWINSESKQLQAIKEKIQKPQKNTFISQNIWEDQDEDSIQNEDDKTNVESSETIKSIQNINNTANKPQLEPKNELEMLQTYEKLINMGYPEQLALLAAKEYHPKYIDNAIDWMDVAQKSMEEMKSNDDEKQDQCEIFQSGYVQMTQSNADGKIYWAVFKGNELHLYDKEAKSQEPEEIIHLTTCRVKKHEEKQQYITLNDVCTGIDYKFEATTVDDNPQIWIIQKILAFKYFLEDCIVDILCQDVNQMSARQQFNRFLLNQRKIARLQREQLPQLEHAVKKAESVDDELKNITTWLQRQKMEHEDREKFGAALCVRNKFWNLLIDTRVCDIYCTCFIVYTISDKINN